MKESSTYADFLQLSQQDPVIHSVKCFSKVSVDDIYLTFGI